MPPSKPKQGLMPSLIDRLIAPESEAASWRQGWSVQQVLDAVRADLEDLLNTRQSQLWLPPELPELTNSLISFGLPDFSSFHVSTPGEREEIGRIIEAQIARFEPRLHDVRAVMVDAGDDREQRIRFHIEAKLRVDPAPEVAFETVVELLTGQTSIRTDVVSP